MNKSRELLERFSFPFLMVTISMLQRAVQNNLVSNEPKVLKSQRWIGFTRWSHITLNIFNPVNIGYIYIITKVCIYIYVERYRGELQVNQFVLNPVYFPPFVSG